ncbi:MAG: hypothetical protein KDE45_22610 [Caldilineaceae bacterium]|nr:hypothetical protein [Caldilineaceae bacterium]
MTFTISLVWTAYALAFVAGGFWVFWPRADERHSGIAGAVDGSIVLFRLMAFVIGALVWALAIILLR